MKRALALALSLACLQATVARADEAPKRAEKRESDDRPPPVVRVYTLLGGLSLTAVWWGAGVGTSYLFPDQSGMRSMRTPVTGPWLALGREGCDGSCDTSFYVSSIYYVLSGIAQAGGLAVALESVLVPTSNGQRATPLPGPRTDEPEDAPRREPTETPGGKPLFFLPQPVKIGQSGWGVSVGGLF